MTSNIRTQIIIHGYRRVGQPTSREDAKIWAGIIQRVLPGRPLNLGEVLADQKHGWAPSSSDKMIKERARNNEAAQ
jgi:hypothetical protein